VALVAEIVHDAKADVELLELESDFDFCIHLIAIDDFGQVASDLDKN